MGNDHPGLMAKYSKSETAVPDLTEKKFTRSKPIRALILVFVAAAIVSMLTWANYRFAAASPGGVDFLTHWVGTRAVFRGESPYQDTVAVRVQEIVYGHPAQPGQNEFLDPYLLYLELVFAPFALVPDYTLARSLWMTFLELSTLGIFIVSTVIVNWKPKIGTLAVFLACGFFGYHSVRPIVNGSVATVITLLLIVAVWAIQNGKDQLAGFLLALALGKPNITILPAILLLLWMIGHARWRFIAWFLGNLIVLVAAGMLIIPDWPLQNIAAILRYTSYNPPTTIGAVLEFWYPNAGHWIGAGIYAVLAVILFRNWRRGIGSDFRLFLWVFSLTLVAGQWLFISTGPDNFIILSLPLALVFKSIDDLPHRSPWVIATQSALLIGIWALFLVTIDRSLGNMQNPVMFFPLPAFLLIGLYLRDRGRGFPSLIEENR